MKKQPPPGARPGNPIPGLAPGGGLFTFGKLSYFTFFPSSYSVLITKLCSIPLSEAVIILRS